MRPTHPTPDPRGLDSSPARVALAAGLLLAGATLLFALPAVLSALAADPEAAALAALALLSVRYRRSIGAALRRTARRLPAAPRRLAAVRRRLVAT